MKRPIYYTLIGQSPVPCTLEELLLVFLKEDSGAVGMRRVAETTVGDYWVSTVFLAIDHNFSRDGPPILFETMVFDNKTRKSTDAFPLGGRCATWLEAEKLHANTVSKLRAQVEK